MSTRVVDQVDSWDDRSFSGGYRELQDLADSEFSGVVRAGGAELYMARGVVVGINRGDITDFQSSGTVYEAPTDALPLLAIMQERSDEVRAKYYTEDTSISKVDKTLSDGGFTGFIELSENVLSGDYYLVYHAGTSMSVAYVGESGRLIEGDEAFETADDEVGIYEVRPVGIEPIDIPDPEDDEGSAGEEPEAAAGGGGVEADSETGPEASATPASEPSDGSGPPGQSDSSAAADDSPAESGGDETVQQPSQGPAQQPPSTRADTENQPAAGTVENTASERTEAGDEPSTPRAEGSARAEGTESNTASRTAESESRERRDGQRSAAANDPGRATQAGASDGTRQTDHTRDTGPQQPQNHPRGQPQSPQKRARSQQARQSAQSRQTTSPAEDIETKAIPSLDPDQTAVPDAAGESSDPIPSPEPTQSESRPPQDEPTQPEPSEPAPSPTTARPEEESETQHPQAEQRTEPAATPPTEPDEPVETPSAEPEVDSQRLDELEGELAEKDEEIDDLEAELDSVTEERDALEDELDALRTERDELQSEVEELRGDLQRLEEELGAATDAERRLTADEALAGTDIFVRYRSKGKATLEKAHGTSTRRDEVNENLRLEKHTQFDADTVSVGGQSYDDFLESTLEYQFVRWAVRELLFEIRDTGHEKALSDLYDVLPRIDRAELSGVIEVTYTEDGQETQSQEAFDVVLRDRMGNPLLAANLNDTREATTESMMERLITSAERVGQSSEGFSGAFLVTESFFDPGALEIASDATRGGLLSRDKRKSFVNLSRKRGYHLCLVEARNENFHLAVPEL
jgi:hypothetical protein